LLTTIRQALYLLGREQRWRWALLVALALGTSLLEVVAAGLVYVLLVLVSNPTGAVDLPLLGDVRRFAGGADERTLLLSLVSLMAAFFLVRAVAIVAAEYIMSRVANVAGARLSTRLVKGYLSLPYAFHLTRNSSELVRNGHQAVMEVVISVFSPLVRIAAEVVLVLGILILLVLVSPLGTALAMLVVGAAAMVLMVVVQPRLKRLGRTAHLMQKETLQSLQQSLHGVRDIKILGREAFFSESYARSRRRLARTAYIRGAANQLPHVVIETSLVGFILLFFGITVARSAEGLEALSVLGLFAYAGLRLQPSLQRIIMGLNTIKFSTAPTADLYRDLQLTEEQTARSQESERLPFERDLVLEGVSFRYEGTDRDALTDVTLRLERGEQIGICGPTGGGKSTFIDVVAGLLAPTAGRVLVDGRDIARDPRAWQRNLGVVPQMVFLIDDTLRRNIALGIEDSQIDAAALQAAVTLAQLDRFVESLPDGLETKIGERGVRVSGGQRQRIAIARALYGRPQVLIFDEGTSALDNATEHELMLSLEKLRSRHTILLVAHRLSTVRDSDRVILIDDGRVAGVDTFDGLRLRNDLFRDMAGMA
jgi:ATP-binding cassette, subfamily B, bacterial PglK